MSYQHEEPGIKRKRRKVCPRCGAWLDYSLPVVNPEGVRVMSGQWGHTFWMGDLFGPGDRELCDEIIIDPTTRRPGETDG